MPSENINPFLIQKTVPMRFGIIFCQLILFIHMKEWAQLLFVIQSALSKKVPAITRLVSSSFQFAFKCCSFKCLFECKNCIPSLREQYHTVRFTSKQLNTFPSIVFKVFHFLYFPSLVNKAASCKSECLKSDFQVLLRLLNKCPDSQK